MRDENHHAWWEYVIFIALYPAGILAMIIGVAVFICVVVPIGIIGAGCHWLATVGR